MSSLSTTDEILAGVDLTGRSVLVTGVSAGLGVETARALVAHGAEVVTGRPRPRQGGAASRMRKAADAGRHRRDRPLDLASLARVRAFADALVADGGARST